MSEPSSQAQFLRQILQQSTSRGFADDTVRSPLLDSKRQRSTSNLQSENASTSNSPLRGRKPFGFKGQPSQTIKPSSSSLYLNDSGNNFKVVVRVRPPLQRELLQDGSSFCSVIKVNNEDKNHVSKEIILHEYLGMAVDEHAQMLDMQKNPGLCT